MYGCGRTAASFNGKPRATEQIPRGDAVAFGLPLNENAGNPSQFVAADVDRKNWAVTSFAYLRGWTDMVGTRVEIELDDLAVSSAAK